MVSSFTLVNYSSTTVLLYLATSITATCSIKLPLPSTQQNGFVLFRRAIVPDADSVFLVSPQEQKVQQQY